MHIDRQWEIPERKTNLAGFSKEDRRGGAGGLFEVALKVAGEGVASLLLDAGEGVAASYGRCCDVGRWAVVRSEKRGVLRLL